jgi:hypothetical protein
LADRGFFAGSMLTFRNTTDPAPDSNSAASTPENRQSLKRRPSMMAPGKPRTKKTLGLALLVAFSMFTLRTVGGKLPLPPFSTLFRQGGECVGHVGLESQYAIETSQAHDLLDLGPASSQHEPSRWCHATQERQHRSKAEAVHEIDSRQIQNHPRRLPVHNRPKLLSELPGRLGIEPGVE